MFHRPFPDLSPVTLTLPPMDDTLYYDAAVI